MLSVGRAGSPFTGLLTSILTIFVLNRVNKYLEKTRLTQPKTTAKDPYLSWKWRNFLVSFIHSVITGVGAILWYDLFVILPMIVKVIWLISTCYPDVDLLLFSLVYHSWNMWTNTQCYSPTEPCDWHAGSSQQPCLLLVLFFSWVLRSWLDGDDFQPQV